MVDCLIRLAGFTGKSVVLLTHPSQPEECFRRRAQVSYTPSARPVSYCIRCSVPACCAIEWVSVRVSVHVCAGRAVWYMKKVKRACLLMQVLSFMEQLLLMYRTVVSVPCWLLFYEGIGMGALLTSLIRGSLHLP